MKLVIHNGSAVWGGNEKWLTTLSLGLLARDHEIVVSCREGAPLWERLQREGIPTVALRPGGELDLPSHLRFARWLRRSRPDALLLTSWNRTPSAVRAARRAGVPRVVVRLGIVRPLPPRGRYARAFRRVDALIVNASEIREEWLRSAPWFRAADVRVVFNGIRLSPTLAAASPASCPAVESAAPTMQKGPRGLEQAGGPRRASLALRDRLGLAPEARLIAGAGHVTHRKGFDLLLQALARLGLDDLHAVIFGSGPEEAALRTLAEELGVAPRVHWPGFEPELIPLLRQCDLFVLPSRNEGMANVMLEAMTAGVPVVATEISGVRDALGAILGRTQAGWIVPPEDPEAMARAIGQVLAGLQAQAEPIAARVDEARHRIREWFTIERMVEEAEGVLFPATRVLARSGT